VRREPFIAYEPRPGGRTLRVADPAAARARVALEGRFPFRAADAAFLAYLDRVAPPAPAPFLARGFRHWIPTKRLTRGGQDAPSPSESARFTP
jgi:hypothetical protein